MGEFLPYFHRMFVAALGGLHFFKTMTYIQGTRELDASVPPSIPNVLFCFESTAGTITHEKVAAHPSELIVHPVSHGWFHTPRALWNEERQALIVQSIYTQTPILQVGNLAPSELYTPDGIVHAGIVIGEGTLHTTLRFTI